jgi:predicted transcriptional regulator YdeE
VELVVRELPAIAVVGVRVVGKPAQLGKLVPKGWEKLRERLDEVPGVIDARRQVGFLIPGEHALPLGRLATYIGVEVAPGGEVPKDLRRVEWPAMRYAEFTYVGSFLAPEFAQFYPSAFVAIKDAGLTMHPEHGWQEHYDDATHDWSDKAKPTNTLVVRFPLAE